MTRNVIKDSAARTLAGFAVLMAMVGASVLAAWWERTDLEWPEYPTAVEDTAFFEPGAPDAATPIVFWDAPGGVEPALTAEPLSLRDFRMRKVVDPSTGRFTRVLENRFFVYRYDKEAFDPATGRAERYFLKIADDRYVRLRPARVDEASVPASADG